ncbi:LysR family transcriptional regulator [Nitratiruptor sp. YY09-18]|uniref:LysR family transcriptional regulator n=1 Tax=Nitratiruptor sp. YY09-18 TaxID=2724901 RepID=UPI0019159031|nr:LysR family transcriptional regulator [Nitratiruptor sp. YY09-18]BCD67319.1 LysR family regulatory protein CidR [Nitratiruptor sp. YY09-18]
MRITLRQLELFIEVAKIGHLTQVAKNFGLSQSAVSMSLKELESILGCKLFERVQKRLVLNEKGRAFFNEVEPLVFKLKDIESEFMSQENRGKLVIGCSTTIADYIMPNIVCEYMNQYPEVQIQLKIGNTAEISQMIEQGLADIGYIEGDAECNSCITTPIGKDELVVVTGDKSLAKKKEHFIDNLMDMKWILREEGSGTRSEFVKQLGQFGSDLNIYLELRHTEAIISVLKEVDQSISCVSKIAVKKYLDAGELYEMKIKGFEFSRDFSQIYYKNKYQSELFKKFSLYARSRFAQILGDKYA